MQEKDLDQAKHGTHTDSYRTQLLQADDAALDKAAQLICSGQLVGFPTETVYGLGADAFNAQAVRSIFAAKGRPSDNPLIAHVCSVDMALSLAEFTPLAHSLCEQFWPGPLTMVLSRRAHVPDALTAGLDSVAVRFPAHPVACELIRRAATPIAAPSANLSGRPSPTLAEHVLEDMTGRIPLILDGGAVQIGLESTIVDARGEVPILLRPGRISAEELRALYGDVLLPSTVAKRPPAPGMKYRHYAPKGELQLVDDWRQAQLFVKHSPAPLFLLPNDSAEQLLAHGANAADIIMLGENNDQIAAALFAALRQADKQGRKFIVAQRVKEAELGRAIMNRLNKAASKK